LKTRTVGRRVKEEKIKSYKTTKTRPDQKRNERKSKDANLGDSLNYKAM